MHAYIYIELSYVYISLYMHIFINCIYRNACMHTHAYICMHLYMHGVCVNKSSFDLLLRQLGIALRVFIVEMNQLLPRVFTQHRPFGVMGGDALLITFRVLKASVLRVFTEKLAGQDVQIRFRSCHTTSTPPLTPGGRGRLLV